MGEPPVDGKASFDALPEHGRIDVAAREGKHDMLAAQLGELPLQHCGDSYGASSLDHRFFTFQQT